MVVVKNPADYSFVKFEKSNTKGKKYDAVLYNKKAKQYKTVPFGSVDYPQYEDKTGLGHYSHMNTYDKERRRLYRLRHAGEDKNKFSSGYFSLKYLW
jgi:hypothetical protein